MKDGGVVEENNEKSSEVKEFEVTPTKLLMVLFSIALGIILFRFRGSFEFLRGADALIIFFVPVMFFVVIPVSILRYLNVSPTEEQLAKQSALLLQHLRRSEEAVQNMLNELLPLPDVNENFRDYVQSLINDAESLLASIQKTEDRVESEWAAADRKIRDEIAAEFEKMLKQQHRTQKYTLMIKAKLKQR